MTAEPRLIKEIPAQIVNEHANFGPLNFNDFFESNVPLTFSAELKNGAALPRGLICTTEGLLTGIPATGSAGEYPFLVIAKNDTATLEAEFHFSIKPSIATEASEQLRDTKSKIWEALSQGIAPTEISDIFSLPITAAEIYYLIQQFATLTVWDAYNLDVPSEKHLLTLTEASPHFNVYDRGSCLVASPKDLFSHERTLADALQTARVMAREVYNRGWTIELVGFDKMMRAAWVELQLLADKFGKELDVLHYQPLQADVQIYVQQAQARRMAAP